MKQHHPRVLRLPVLTAVVVALAASAPTPGIPADHESYMRRMMDLMVAAFQSDATRVCTFRPASQVAGRRPGAARSVHLHGDSIPIEELI